MFKAYLKAGKHRVEGKFDKGRFNSLREMAAELDISKGTLEGPPTAAAPSTARWADAWLGIVIRTLPPSSHKLPERTQAVVFRL